MQVKRKATKTAASWLSNKDTKKIDNSAQRKHEEQVDRRGIQEFFYAQEFKKRLCPYGTTHGPHHAANTLPDVEKHARPAREVRLSIGALVAEL